MNNRSFSRTKHLQIRIYHSLVFY